MKTGLLASFVTALSFAALAQGTVYFSNRVSPGLDAPVYFPDGVTKLSGSQFAVELLVGSSPNEMASLAITGVLTNAPGYFDGGLVNTFVPSGSNAFFRIRFRTLTTFLPEPSYSYDWFWAKESPSFSGVVGDRASPGILSGLGTEPLILGVPRLSIKPTETNTMVISWDAPSSAYALSADYSLEQNPGHDQSDWTTVTNLTLLPSSSEAILPKPDKTMFYRLSIK